MHFLHRSERYRFLLSHQAPPPRFIPQPRTSFSLYWDISRTVTRRQSSNDSKSCSRFSCAIHIFIATSSTATAFYRAVHRSTSPRAVSVIHCVVEDCFRCLLHRPERLLLSLEPASTATAIFPPLRTSLSLSLLRCRALLPLLTAPSIEERL